MGDDTQKHKSIRAVLTANGLFSGLTGLALLIWAADAAPVFGLVYPWIAGVLGGVLVCYAGHILLVAWRWPGWRLMVTYFVLMDILWVLGSIAVLALHLLDATVQGRWGIALAAVIVGTFAVLQGATLRAPQ